MIGGVLVQLLPKPSNLLSIFLPVLTLQVDGFVGERCDISVRDLWDKNGLPSASASIVLIQPHYFDGPITYYLKPRKTMIAKRRSMTEQVRRSFLPMVADCLIRIAGKLEDLGAPPAMPGWRMQGLPPEVGSRAIEGSGSRALATRRIRQTLLHSWTRR